MKPKLIALVGLGAVVALSSFSLLGVFDEKVDFNSQIKPILNKNCIACHGGVKKTANYSLLFKEEAYGAGKSGKRGISPGDAKHSDIIRRLTLTDPDERMPYGKDPLKPDEIELLTKWVNQGANWGDHWAYQTPTLPDVPKIGTFWSRIGLAKSDETDWASTEIDHFVIQKLRDVETQYFASLPQQPSPEADRATLLRRVSLDLTGLPPMEQQITDFQTDKSVNAYEKQVDKLLASPAYGEKWAGMWLDLARYSDTKGYERDPGRKMWRYRDWLIRAFNADKPYDQFLTEQLAGDLLPHPTDETFTATAFHRNTMTNDEGGTQDEEFRTAAVMDRVSTTWDVFQGTTFACVQCHTHPYDPFVHDEYYKYLAFFNNTRDEDITTETPTLRFYAGADSLKLLTLKTWVANQTANPAQRQTALHDVEQMARLMEPKINSHDFDQHKNAALLDAKFFGISHGGSARIKGVTLTNRNRLFIAWGTRLNGATLTIRRDSPTGEILLKQPVANTGNGWNDTIQAFTIPPTVGKHDLFLAMDSPKNPKEWTMIKWVSFRAALPGKADKDLLTLLNTDPDAVPVMLEAVGDLARTTQVFDRGNWLVKKQKVQPDVPKSLPPMTDAAGQPMPRNRLGLARWMTDRRHPLTARVAVNRVWEQLFGLGIVETAEDFGTQGIQPTHRELLDWLAVTFQEQDHWRMKALLKRIVLSATYRQRSDVNPALVAADPNNKWLARGPRVRLSAEQVRDQALAVSGLLSRKMYGPSVMPPQPDGIWQSPYDGATWVPSAGDDKHRRAMYTYWKRTSPYPSMVTFDSPSREFCQVRRIRTNTPLQALVTLNDPVYVEAASRLAQFMAAKATTPDAQIQAGFRRVMGRPIEPRKLLVLTRLYRQTEADYQKHPAEARKLLANPKATPALAALTVTANTMLNLDEVITKE